MLGACGIGHCHPLRLEMGELLSDGEGGLTEGACHATSLMEIGPESKDPPSVHILADRGLAGSIDR